MTNLCRQWIFKMPSSGLNAGMEPSVPLGGIVVNNSLFHLVHTSHYLSTLLSGRLVAELHLRFFSPVFIHKYLWIKRNWSKVFVAGCPSCRQPAGITDWTSSGSYRWKWTVTSQCEPLTSQTPGTLITCTLVCKETRQAQCMHFDGQCILIRQMGVSSVTTLCTVAKTVTRSHQL